MGGRGASSRKGAGGGFVLKTKRGDKIGIYRKGKNNVVEKLNESNGAWIPTKQAGKTFLKQWTRTVIQKFRINRIVTRVTFI